MQYNNISFFLDEDFVSENSPSEIFPTRPVNQSMSPISAERSVETTSIRRRSLARSSSAPLGIVLSEAIYSTDREFSKNFQIFQFRNADGSEFNSASCL